MLFEVSHRTVTFVSHRCYHCPPTDGERGLTFRRSLKTQNSAIRIQNLCSYEIPGEEDRRVMKRSRGSWAMGRDWQWPSTALKSPGSGREFSAIATRNPAK
jgi:hypothetical protein